MLLCCMAAVALNAQTQTVRGMVVDKISQSPVPGAVVQLLNATPVNVATTDANGHFRLVNVPVGKQSLRITYTGYRESLMDNLSVNAGKELVLNIGLEEDVKAMDEVEVVARTDKNKPLNEMSSVSTRAFSVEETQKFAAAVNDPARMATSFAGVVATSDGNNNISIRGNSPNGLLWRMEGVEIPNPNHYSSMGSAGGGISILSAQLLNNSDFSTGAFAAEYGNALSGVFDLKLRKGNNEKKEYTFQAGILGIDASTEGPFRKGKEGSYVVNYRYSTLDLLSKIGVPVFGDASLTYQDLTFNLSMPTQKAGNFTLFGFGGLSSQTRRAKKDTAAWRNDISTRSNARFYSNTGAVGLTHTKLFRNQSYLKTALVASGTQNGDREADLTPEFVERPMYQEQYNQNKVTLSSVYTQKLDARNSFRTGVILNHLIYNLDQKDRSDTTVLVQRLSVDGSTQTGQAFFQWNCRITPQLTSNAGLHYYHVFLNNSSSLEPRASLQYAPTAKHRFSLGYGLHSQLQPVGVYFSRAYTADGGYTEPNRNLGLNKAHHLVAGYDWIFNSWSHLKTEVYYQHLFNIPISTDPTNLYSILNVSEGYNAQPLVNKGLGRNFGLELTHERFLYKNLYYLLSASVYDSKYKAANGQWYNTRYNTNYSSSITIGREWTLSEKRKSRIIGFNIKSLLVGGMRYTPIDLEASRAKGDVVYDANNNYKKQNPDYFRLDLRVSVKRNYRHLTSTLALDLQNATNRRNIGGQYFDDKTGEVKYWYQASLIPILSYRVEF